MRNLIKLMKFLIQLIVGISVSDGFVVVTPMNKAVVAGQRMEMECRTDSGWFVRRWTFHSFTNPSILLKFDVYNRSHHLEEKLSRSGFGIDVDKNGSVVFYSNVTKLQDAGIYTCRAEKEGNESRHSAALVVFHSEAVCETNTSSDYVLMQCKVQFRGGWSPTVEWKQHGADFASERYQVTNVNDTSNNTDKTITSSLIMGLSSVKCGSYFTSKTYFEWHNNSIKVDATNIPDFNYTWKSPSLNVACYSMSTGESIYILFAIISVSFFMLAVAISIIGCIVVRTKTAEWLAKLLAVQNRTDVKSNRETLRTVERTRDNNDDHSNLHREGDGLQSDLDVPIYSEVCKNKKGRSCVEFDIYQDDTDLADAGMAYSTYCPAEDVLFDNIRSYNNEPPEHVSIGLYAEAESFE